MRAWACAALLAAGCARGGDEVGRARAPLDAWCEAMVTGVGLVDVETDYLPHVVACENGAADYAALQTQAVAARSYLYYRLDGTGEIGDGTSDQVYSCGRPPGAIHAMAVESTSGLVLQYLGTQVAAFYVAGALQDRPDCQGGADDPTSTERFVTYNEGLSGDQVNQTPLGLIDPANHANRGCMSQNGSDCLGEAGRGYEAMLRFYYGEDIEVVRATGACVTGGPDAGPIEADAGSDASGAPDETEDDISGGCAVGGGDRSGRRPGGWWLLFAAALGLRRGRRTSVA